MKSCTLLLVDDDDDIRETLAEALVESGHHVIQARDGQAALDHLATAQELPGLILLDLMMPVMDGIEFRRRQVAHAPWSAIPVVLLSADPGARERGRDLALAAILLKPVKLATLLDAIAQLC
jgi:two-component system, chemotaxis family, chemotaxis protein CheY